MYADLEVLPRLPAESPDDAAVSDPAAAVDRAQRAGDRRRHHKGAEAR
ncbi:hypothetical protein [Actinoplanes sp. NPDC049265]